MMSWRNESVRHSLASKGLITSLKIKEKNIVDKIQKRLEGDICQAGLDIAEYLTEPDEEKKFNNIWMAVQDTAKPEEVTDQYELKDSVNRRKFAERIIENIEEKNMKKDIRRCRM